MDVITYGIIGFCTTAGAIGLSVALGKLLRRKSGFYHGRKEGAEGETGARATIGKSHG